MWHVIIPVKDWDAAKSRIALPPVDRRALAEAMATDTIEAVAAAHAVAHVTVVTTSAAMKGSPVLAAADIVLRQPPGDLDAALHWAAQQSVPPGMPVVALVADLPALTSPSLDVALRAAEFEQSTFVVDRHGSGSTMLTAQSPEGLRPSFGMDSAARHVTLGAVPLAAGAVAPSLTCDVDTLDDLAAAERLGVGRCTSLVTQTLGLSSGLSTSIPRVTRLTTMTDPVHQATVHTFDANHGDGSVITDDGRVIPFEARAWQSGALLTLRQGQRLKVQVTEDPAGPRVTTLTLATFSNS